MFFGVCSNSIIFDEKNISGNFCRKFLFENVNLSIMTFRAKYIIGDFYVFIRAEAVIHQPMSFFDGSLKAVFRQSNDITIASLISICMHIRITLKI